MIDNGKAVFQYAGLTNTSWVNGYGYSDHNTNVPHGIMLHGDIISQFAVERTKFTTARVHHVSPTGSATPTIVDTVIMGNMGGQLQKGSRAGLSLKSATPRKIWTFDFEEKLLFPINHVRMVTASGGSDFASYKTSFEAFQLTVETSTPVTSVFVEVDASAFDSHYA